MKKAFAFAVGLLHGPTATHGGSLHIAGSLRMRPHAEKELVKSGPESDASWRFMKNEAQEHEDDAQNLHEDSPHVEPKDPEALQHEIERMTERMKRMDTAAIGEMADELDDIEASLENAEPALHSEIVATREELCAERGFRGHELQECDDFMHIACGKSGRGTLKNHECKHFFGAHGQETVAQTTARGREVRVRLEKGRQAEVESEVAALGRDAAWTGRGSKETGAAIAEVGSPAPAPGPAPGPSLFGGKLSRALPDQGFMGDSVEHKDRETKVRNWGEEYGLPSGHRSFFSICADHPNNEWCLIHGYVRRAEPRSGALPSRVAVAATLVLASALRVLA